MQVRYEKVGRTGKNRFTGEMREPIDRAYSVSYTHLDVYKRQTIDSYYTALVNHDLYGGE